MNLPYIMSKRDVMPKVEKYIPSEEEKKKDIFSLEEG